MGKQGIVGLLVMGWVGAAGVYGCSAEPEKTNRGGAGGGSSSSSGSVSSSSGTGLGGFSPGTGGAGGMGGDPNTCEGAASAKSYIGCEFYPTVVANDVWSVFDFTVVVANAGDMAADVVVKRGALQLATIQVQPNSLEKIFLPWVPELKGPDADSCRSLVPLSNSVVLEEGAYHLTSSSPVAVYQFNALEYKSVGGPPGKNWSSCPSNMCSLSCFSYSNDASLLLPATTLTGNYRITAQKGWDSANMGGYFAVTATEDNTTVTVKVSQTGAVLAGNGIPATGAGGIFSFKLNAGGVAEIVGAPSADLGGSQVSATAPVQVIAGIQSVQAPLGTQDRDHIEESVFPAETLGRHYFVSPPTGPNATAVGHLVRLYGNVDNTFLTYAGKKPLNAPSTINAGQVVDLGQVTGDFEISGDHEFAVASFMLGAELVDPAASPPDQRGDPAQTLATAVEQYRKRYIFLAPDDYDFSFVDIIQPVGAAILLDGAALSAQVTPISNNYGISRVKLKQGNKGAHLLEADMPVGIQVFGYGAYTSYHYPGGLDLRVIAPPPPPPK